MLKANTSAIIELGNEFQQLSDVVLDEDIRQGTFIAGAEVQKEARSLVPVDTSALRLSIENSVGSTGTGFLADIGPTQPYGAHVEFGQPPGTYVSPAALAGWAKRKGLNPYAVSRAIQNHGTKPQPYMAPAFEEKQESVVEVLAQAVVNAFRKALGTTR